MGNKNKPGYKKTKVGWIPDDWECFSLSKDIELISGQHVNAKYCTNSEQGTEYITGPTCFKKGHVIQHTFTSSTSKLCQQGDILITVKGSGTGTVARADKIYCISRQIMAVRSKAWSQDFLFSRFIFDSKRYKLLSEGLIPGISRADILTHYIPIPPLPEQKKIAEILSTWDEAIELTRKLIDAKKKRKKALIQKLLSGKKRLPGFWKTRNDIHRFRLDWQILQAREIFEIYSAKKCRHEPVLSVTQDGGVVHRDSLDRRIKTSEANTSSYKLVEPGDFVISLRSFQGGLEFSQYRGVVSPAYHVIRPKIKIDDVFYKYYFKSYDFIGHLAVAMIGIRDGKQVNFDDFAHMYLPYPPINEQKAIGSILLTSDEEIKIHEQKLATLEKQKRGLMQKLLTGEIRVKT